MINNSIRWIGGGPDTKPSIGHSYTSAIERQEIVASPAQKDFLLDFIPENHQSLLLFKNNTILGPDEYTITDNLVQLTNPANQGDVVRAISISSIESENLTQGLSWN